MVFILLSHMKLSYACVSIMLFCTPPHCIVKLQNPDLVVTSLGNNEHVNTTIKAMTYPYSLTELYSSLWPQLWTTWQLENFIPSSCRTYYSTYRFKPCSYSQVSIHQLRVVKYKGFQILVLLNLLMDRSLNIHEQLKL